jgi:SAM-dependent methyltransferase
MILGRFVPPMRFKFPLRVLKGAGIKVLDVGCGNDSSLATKHWFPDCYYCGVDIQRYNSSDAAEAAMDEFYQVGVDGSGYEAIPDASFDLIIMSHVIEHMKDPWPILELICRKLKPGGYIWVAFPSVRSLAFPSAKGSLNYCDDDTHVRIVDVKDVSNRLLDSGVRVMHAGRSHDAIRTLVGLAFMPAVFVRRALGLSFRGPRVWYVYGFEDHVFGRRPA